MREMRYLLTPGNTLIVRGPSSVQLLNGEVTVLGAPLEIKRKLIIRHEKQLPFESSSEVNLEILLGQSGKVFEVEGSTIPKTWRLAAEALTEMRVGVVLVVGAADVGKSTFCTYVANELLSKRLAVRVIDADIGQADIGPPATVSCAEPSDHLPSLLDLKPDRLMFIGHVTPSHVESRLIDATKRLIDSNAGCSSLTIINTDGWVLGSDAIRYKINLISSIEPDLVIGISTDSELHPILSLSRVRSMTVHAAKEVLERSRSDRRTIRQFGYRRFLDGGSLKKIRLDMIRICKPKTFPTLQVPLNSEFKNLLVGLSDENGYLLQIGILMDVDADSLCIFSRTVANARTVEFGYVKLLTDGTELGHIENE
jgi:polynucleotide 5'-hydroxyl-kinase GRC3/NOL9